MPVPEDDRTRKSRHRLSSEGHQRLCPFLSGNYHFVTVRLPQRIGRSIDPLSRFLQGFVGWAGHLSYQSRREPSQKR